MADAVVAVPGAEPWSGPGHGERRGVAALVVHGFTANPVGTRPLGQALAAAGFGVQVPRLPGHGTSVRDLGTTRYADWYGLVEARAEQLRAAYDRVAVVGHSMGGTIALDLAARRPELVDAVVPINPQVLDRPGLMAAAAPLLSLVIPALPRGMVGLPTNDLARSEVEEQAYRMVATRAATSLLRELPRIRAGLLDVVQPLLVIRSPHDHTVDPRNATTVLELVGSPDVRELICQRSFHVPQLDHDADLVVASTVSFLDEVLLGRAS